MASVQDYFEKQVGDVRAIALALKDVLDAEIPATEVKLAWGFPCWLVDGCRVASIIAHTDRCNLQMWQGSALVEAFPSRIEGTGKDLRHIKVRAVAEVDGELREIIKAALKLDPKKIR